MVVVILNSLFTESYVCDSARLKRGPEKCLITAPACSHSALSQQESGRPRPLRECAKPTRKGPRGKMGLSP